jgi:hypothetical protein
VKAQRQLVAKLPTCGRKTFLTARERKLVSECTSYEDTGLRMSEKGMLRRIFGPKGNEIIGSCRTLHNVELHNLYSSPNIIRVIKPCRMSRGGGEACKNKNFI